MKTARIIYVIIVALTFSLHSVRAQQFNLSPVPVDAKMSVGLKVNKPFIKNSEYDNYPDGFSGVYKLYGYVPLRNNWQINAEIPLVISKAEDLNETGLGNIYMEFQKAFNQDKTTWLSLGIYIPTVNGDEYMRQAIGVLSDSYRFVQYLDAFTISSTFGYNLNKKPGPVFGICLGPDLMIPTSDDWDVELMLHYGVKGGYQFNSIATWAELSGSMLISESGSLSDRWINQGTFGAQLNRGIFRPGVFYGIPLEAYNRSITSGIFGLNLQLVLN